MCNRGRKERPNSKGRKIERERKRAKETERERERERDVIVLN